MRQGHTGPGSLLGRWRRGLRFAWDTSDSPALAMTRRWFDGELPRPIRYVESRPAGGGLTIAYGGMPDGLRHVLPFMERQRDPTGPPPVHTPHRVPRRAVADLRTLPDTDLVALGVTQRTAHRLPGASSVLAPFRVQMVVPVVPDPEAMRRRVSRKDRQHFARQQRALDWRLEEATGPADFAYFYDRFHQPTMRHRHGPATRSVDRQTAYEQLFRRGVLFFVTQGGRPVSGLLCRWGPTRADLTLRLAGVLDADEEHYRSGVYMASYILLQEWAARHGVRRLDLSGCEPFLSKGIFQFKRKLHPAVIRPDNHFGGKRLWLHVRRDRPEVRDFLVANPLIGEGGDGRLEAVYFHDDHRPPRLDLRWQGTTITRQRLIDLDRFWPASRSAADRSRPSGSAS